jgi:hypothetical protein
MNCLQHYHATCRQIAWSVPTIYRIPLSAATASSDASFETVWLVYRDDSAYTSGLSINFMLLTDTHMHQSTKPTLLTLACGELYAMLARVVSTQTYYSRSTHSITAE